ncbi:PREDICTED: DPH3 homolog isoform X2 [Calidris pugnax]|uniref:DPH3 homolog isoform X2 n=1 Tax=Calidris pugnax TaxID=198806 RepID=UPI00071CED8E|nr:PREDICTED: DPH3 homolog isoform X2 [Calidris pugnax]
MAVFHDEVEIEDFEYDEETETYSYPCPCGDRFLITREDLENGEDVATCPSCSLILRVIYDQVNTEKNAAILFLPVSGETSSNRTNPKLWPTPTAPTGSSFKNSILHIELANCSDTKGRVSPKQKCMSCSSVGTLRRGMMDISPVTDHCFHFHLDGEKDTLTTCHYQAEESRGD